MVKVLRSLTHVPLVIHLPLGTRAFASATPAQPRVPKPALREKPDAPPRKFSVEPPPPAAVEPGKRVPLATLDTMMRSTAVCEHAKTLFERTARFHQCGLAHQEAFRIVGETASPELAASVRGEKSLVAALADHVREAKLVLTSQPPPEFVAIPATEEALASATQRTLVVAHGYGLLSEDSEQRRPTLDGRPLTQVEAVEITGLPLNEDGTLDRGHAVIVVATATAAHPVPGLRPGHSLVFDHDPLRGGIVPRLYIAGHDIAQRTEDALDFPYEELTMPELREAQVLDRMYRVVETSSLLATQPTSPMGTPFSALRSALAPED